MHHSRGLLLPLLSVLGLVTASPCKPKDVSPTTKPASVASSGVSPVVSASVSPAGFYQASSTSSASAVASAAVYPAGSSSASSSTPRDTNDSSTSSISQLVAFGDELSDNGNGSFAHGITGDPATVYGYGTWTNGPVAVSYLADLLGVPLIDYAFGGCCGAEKFGATIDSAYTASDAGAPSIKDQITNYTSSGAQGASNSLGFIWAGENDLSKHTDAFWLGDPKNTDFANNFASITASNVQKLVDAGVKNVVVANIYPKHLAPVTKTYLCGTNTDCVTTWGKVIQQANDKLKSTLASMNSGSTKIIYYDSFSFFTNLLNNAAANGFTQSLSDFCDGGASDPNQKWDECWNSQTYQLDANGFFWVNYIQPTTQVYKLVAADMRDTIKQALSL